MIQNEMNKISESMKKLLETCCYKAYYFLCLTCQLSCDSRVPCSRGVLFYNTRYDTSYYNWAVGMHPFAIAAGVIAPIGGTFAQSANAPAFALQGPRTFIVAPTPVRQYVNATTVL